MGMGVFCGGFFPLFEIFLGSSSVWLEGARAARVGTDITKHCIFSNPKSIAKSSDLPIGPSLGTRLSQPKSSRWTANDAPIESSNRVGLRTAASGSSETAALTWRATLADPTLPSLLIATEEGRPVYEHMGYTSLFRFTLWSRERPGSKSERMDERG